jgi:hypothetical protein
MHGPLNDKNFSIKFVGLRTFRQFIVIENFLAKFFLYLNLHLSLVRSKNFIKILINWFTSQQNLHNLSYNF